MTFLNLTDYEVDLSTYFIYHIFVSRQPCSKLKKQEDAMKRWRKIFGLCALGIVVFSAILGFSTDAIHAGEKATEATDELPSPFDIASFLDLSCHRTDPVPPPVDGILLRHLNPVLLDLGVKETYADLGDMTQLCAPVVKNYKFPNDRILEYLKWIDLACFEAEGEPANIPLELSHLNPVLRDMGLPDENVWVGHLEELCVPVVKNEAYPPEEVRRLVEHIDVACYEIETGPTEPFALQLTHLNPVLIDLGIKHQWTFAYDAVKLCVPVMKDDQVPPEEIIDVVRWIDFKKYRVDPLTWLPHVNLNLTHLNPLFANGDIFDTMVWDAEELMVPVAKNGEIPPQ